MEHEVLLPRMGITMTSAKIVEWKKAEGDAIELGEDLYTMETGKSTVDVQTPFAGTLKKIVVPAGEEAQVEDLVAIIED